MDKVLSLIDAGRLLRRGEVTPAELVESCLARIDRFEPEVHAWALVDAEAARREAHAQTRDLSQGKLRGPLHGIPVGIKDIIDVAGWPTLAGSSLRAGHVAPRDARIVEKLRRAGAILLGKTVTTEFACFEPAPTRNPWNLAHTPGGSSSGSAAAVALGMCLGALGSQTGGSITRPASYCGVAGCKPTFGLVSLDGIVPVTRRLDHPGPIARRIGDLAMMLEALAEPARVSAGASSEPPAYAAQLVAGHVPRLAVIEDYFLETCTPAMSTAFGSALDKLREA